MSQLHLHVISTDFNSECLKRKRHWNSFNSEFLIPVERIITELKGGDDIERKFSFDIDNMLALEKGSMYCHRCKRLE